MNGDVQLPVGSVLIHQFVKEEGAAKGAADEVLDRFLAEYPAAKNTVCALNVRTENTRATTFYARHDFHRQGTIPWADGIINGDVLICLSSSTPFNTERCCTTRMVRSTTTSCQPCTNPCATATPTQRCTGWLGCLRRAKPPSMSRGVWFALRPRTSATLIHRRWPWLCPPRTPRTSSGCLRAIPLSRKRRFTSPQRRRATRCTLRMKRPKLTRTHRRPTRYRCTYATLAFAVLVRRFLMLCSMRSASSRSCFSVSSVFWASCMVKSTLASFSVR